MVSLKQIRHELHKIPEASGNEKETSKSIIRYLKKCNPDVIETNIAGYGIIAIFKSGQPGPTIVIRSELDALPIKEKNTFSYHSKFDGFSHSCGHDGHMTIVLGLGFWLKKEIKKLRGNVILLFQPAEENATGAQKVLSDSTFSILKPDYIFALHNIPGFPQTSIIIKNGVFSSASKGLIINLEGETSHAAQPELGNNPVLAMTSIIEEIVKIPNFLKVENKAGLITIIHARLGKIAFGTSPGEATIMATFRSSDDALLQNISDQAENLVKKITKKHQLKYSLEWVDNFPALKNDKECINIIISSAKKLGYQFIILKKPFLWSEDFSYFTKKIKGAMFGIGSGLDYPNLHNPKYDFPDELLDIGVCFFQQLIKNIISNINNEGGEI